MRARSDRSISTGPLDAGIFSALHSLCNVAFPPIPRVNPRRILMALLEKEVVITTKHGRQPAFTACPEAHGPFPGIILYMDAPGYREELFNMSRRIAKHGYFCIVPDLYYRYGTLRFDTPRRNDPMSAVIKAAYTSLSNGDVAGDPPGILAFLAA